MSSLNRNLRRPARQKLFHAGRAENRLADDRMKKLLEDFAALPELERRRTLWRIGHPRRLYKYRPIPRGSTRSQLEDLLLGNKLWMATPDTFNDPFDGRAAYDVGPSGPELRRQLERWFRRVAGLKSHQARLAVTSDMVAGKPTIEARFKSAHDRILGQLGICALSQRHNNPLLWAHYAHDHKGICVQISPFQDLNALLAQPMEYSDDYPVVTNPMDGSGDAVKAILRKSSHWSYEEEWRIVGLDEPNRLRPFRPQALTAVILGMRISDSDRQYVHEIMDERERRFGVRPRIFQAEPAARQYRVRVRWVR